MTGAACEAPAGDALVAYARGVLAQARAIGGEAVTRRRFRLPFLEIDFATTAPDYLAACERALIDVEAAPSAVKRVKLSVIDPGNGSVPAPRPWWEPQYIPLDVETRLAHCAMRGFYFHDTRMWTLYDAAASEGVQLIARPGGYPPWETSAPLRPFLHWIYADGVRRLVHAATLGIDGRGVLIAGHGGAGKSGLTLSGVIAGLDSVGDDYVLLSAGEEPKAFPVYRIAKQDAAGFARLGLGRYLPDPGPLNWQGKHEFDFADIGRGRRAREIRLSAILLPTIRHGERSRIVPASAREAMLALAPSGIFQMPGERSSGPRFFADLVRSLPAYRIEMGPDGSENAGLVADLIGRIVR